MYIEYNFYNYKSIRFNQYEKKRKLVDYLHQTTLIKIHLTCTQKTQKIERERSYHSVLRKRKEMIFSYPIFFPIVISKCNRAVKLHVFESCDQVFQITVFHLFFLYKKIIVKKIVHE